LSRLLPLSLLAVTALLVVACAVPAAPPPAPAATQAAPTQAAATQAAPAPTEAAATQAAPAPTQAAAMQPVTFQAGYLPQGNISFVAAYVAKEKGYFADEGLDVTIEHASPGGGEQFQRLAAKDIQFTTQTAENFAKQVETAAPPFVGVAVFGHATDHGLIVLEDSAIKDIPDLAGKKIGIKTGEGADPPWLLGMLKSAGLDFDDVELVQVGFDPRVILPESGAGQVDALQVFKSNEPDTLDRMGFKTRLFNPEDYGMTFLGQMYVTHSDLIRDDPEMVQKFVDATMKGLAFTLDPANANEVTDIVMKYAGADASREHNQFIWETEAEYVTSDGTQQHGLGYADPQEWETMMNTMVEFGSLKAPVAIEKLWDPQFVEKAAVQP
jgi:ABC-type nitrate/sulfonate/bicarbonate transport system substrate-binding protein